MMLKSSQGFLKTGSRDFVRNNKVFRVSATAKQPVVIT